MRLLRGGEIVADDWRRADDDAAIIGGGMIVPFARLQAEFDTLRVNGSIGVEFPNDGAAEDLEPYFDGLDLIAIDFPAFTDGRGYSLAHQIRGQYQFAGELRATGNILPDQLAFLRQCGFDAFEVDDRFGLDVWQRAATTMSLSYQRGYGPSRGFAPAEILKLRGGLNR